MLAASESSAASSRSVRTASAAAAATASTASRSAPSVASVQSRPARPGDGVQILPRLANTLGGKETRVLYDVKYDVLNNYTTYYKSTLTYYTTCYT
eukprot:7123129-Pyramimonas_sp.AAC.1